MGSLCWSRLLPGPVDPRREDPMPEQVCWQGLWSHGGPTQEQPVPEGLHQWKGRTLGQIVKSCSPWEELTLKEFVENCLP